MSIRYRGYLMGLMLIIQGTIQPFLPPDLVLSVAGLFLGYLLDRNQDARHEHAQADASTPSQRTGVVGEHRLDGSHGQIHVEGTFHGNVTVHQYVTPGVSEPDMTSPSAQAPPVSEREGWWSNRYASMQGFLRDRYTRMRHISLADYIKAHKWALAAKTTIAAYVWVNYHLLSSSWYLHKRERWMYWRADKSLSQLLELPRTDLAHELMIDIQHHYHTAAQTLNDVAGPLDMFLQAVQEEIEEIEHYMRYARVVKMCLSTQQLCLNKIGSLVGGYAGIIGKMAGGFIMQYCTMKPFFALDEEFLNECTHWRTRLTFMRTLLLEWCAQMRVHKFCRIT